MRKTLIGGSLLAVLLVNDVASSGRREVKDSTIRNNHRIFSTLRLRI